MATTGTNYTTKWKLIDGTLTISPISGNSGEMRGAWTYFSYDPYIKEVVDMTDEEWLSVTHIVFAGSIKIKMHEFASSNYYSTVSSLFAQSLYSSVGDVSLSNVTSIDVRGLDTTGCTSFYYMFINLTSLVEIIGLDTLDTSSVNDYSSMFHGTSLSELDLSSFSNMNTANISNMFSSMNYLESVILPNNFSRTSPALNNEETQYKSLGVATSQVHATNPQTQVTVTSDEDFFALESGQGGTWTRDISGSATLLFRVNAVQRNGNNVTVSYFFTTSTATAYVNLKESSASSFPQSPTETISLTGSGNGTLNLTLATDSSYEIQFIVSDGETNLYVFASVDSNVLLIEVDNNGNVRAAGDIEDGYGNKLSEMIDLFYPVGSYYETSKSQAEFDPNVVWGGTWELEVAGIVHVSSGTGYAVNGALTNTKDGGEATHVLTPSETATKNHSHTMSHTHGMAHTHSHNHKTAGWIAKMSASGTVRSIPCGFTNEDRSGQFTSDTDATASSKSNTDGPSTSSTGGQTEANGSAHNNMPPYIVVNRWHRTA